MVALVTRNPAIAMPPINPASGVTHGPVPSGRASVPVRYRLPSTRLLSDLCTPDSELLPGSKGSSPVRRSSKGIGKANLRLETTEPGGRVKFGPHQMRALCQDEAEGGQACETLSAGCCRSSGPPAGLRFPAGPIGSAVKECSLPLQLRHAGNRRRQPGSFHHFGIAAVR